MRTGPVGVWRSLGVDYWRFFTAAFAFDLGTGLYIFLLSLYLIAHGFNEQSIGNFTAALTIGNLAGTLPATILARRKGLRWLLLAGFICSPLAAAVRVFALHPGWQLTLAFAQGVTLSAWPIAFAPTVARLTTEEHRSAGFSIVFATGIGMGTLAGLAGGWIPGVLLAHGLAHSESAAMQLVLLSACAVVLCGAWPVKQLKLDERLSAPKRQPRVVHPFLLRFLPPFLLWSAATASFPVFGAIWLHKSLGLDLGHVGLVFSASQLAQCAAVLASPLLFRVAGLSRGLAAAQLGSALVAVCLGLMSGMRANVVFYLLYSAGQFMCGPGIYNLLMSRIPEAERSTASAVQNACSAVCQAASAALTGFVIVHSGYGAVLGGNACLALCAGLLFLTLGSRVKPSESDGASVGVREIREVQT
jgi:MFS family permease